MLRLVADVKTRACDELKRVFVAQSGDLFEQRGFAAAIRAVQAELLAAVQLKPKGRERVGVAA